MHRTKLLLPAAALLLAGLACSLFSRSEPTATPEPPTQTPFTVVVTATAEPQPTAVEPTAEQDASASATLKQNLNVRGGPSTSYAVTGSLPGGTTVPVIGKNSDGSWLLVSFNGSSGWISTPYTDATGLEDVPVVSAPPPPPPSPTSNGGSLAPTATSSGGSGGSGGGQTAPSDSDITTDVNIKNDAKSYNGVISYPNGDTIDQIYVHIVGFDSVTTSGDVSFTLTCSGEGAGNVKVFGGGSCNNTWTKFFTNDSDQQLIRVYLDSGGSAYVNWTLVISANN